MHTQLGRAEAKSIKRARLTLLPQSEKGKHKQENNQMNNQWPVNQEAKSQANTNFNLDVVSLKFHFKCNHARKTDKKKQT